MVALGGILISVAGNSGMMDVVQRGRRTVAVVLFFQLALAVGVLALAMALGRWEQALRRMVKLLCEIGLMYSLWTGDRWARWFYVGGFLLGAGGLALVGLAAPRPGAALAVLPLVALLGWLAYLLGCSSSVNAFFDFQRRQHAPGRQRPVAPEADPGEGEGLRPGPMARMCGGCGAEVPTAIVWCPECGIDYQEQPA
jgi:hypothetical protein